MYNGVASAIYNALRPYGRAYPNRPGSGGGFTPPSANQPFYTEVDFHTFWLSIDEVIDSYDVSTRFRNAVSYSLTGTWPAGMSISGDSLVGTPTQAGVFSDCTITATNANGIQVSNTFTVDVCAEEDKMYFDATTGDDGDDGSTPELAKQSLTAYEAAAEAASPGDRLLFKRGESWSDTGTTYGDIEGVSGNHIVMSAYGTGAKPIINSTSGSVIRFAPSSGAYYTRYITISELELTSDTGTTSISIYVNDGRNAVTDMTFMACTFKNGAGQGTQVSADSAAPRITNIIADGNTYDGSPNTGALHSEIDNHWLTNNTFNNCGEDVTYDWAAYLTYIDTGEHSCNTILNTTGGTQGMKHRGGWNLRVAYNNIDINNSGKVGMSVGSAVLADSPSDNVIVEGNVIRNATIWGLALSDNDGPQDVGLWSTNFIIRYNEVTEVYNNTLFSSGVTEVMQVAPENTHVNCIFKNNIVMRDNSGASFGLVYIPAIEDIDTVFDNNIYEFNGGYELREGGDSLDLAQWRTLSGDNANSVSGASHLATYPYKSQVQMLLMQVKHK